MARTYTRAALRTRIRQLADMVNSRLVEEPELNDWIDVANAEYWEFLYQTGVAYKESTAPLITADGIAETFPLPADFLGLLKVEYRVSTAPVRYQKLHPVQLLEDHRYAAPGGPAIGFRPVNGTLQLYPLPGAGQVYRLRYVPMAAKLTHDTDTIDGYNGWEQLVVLDCVINCLLKEESDASGWMQERAELRARIKASAEDRMIADGGHIVDVYADGCDPDPADFPRYGRSRWGG